MHRGKMPIQERKLRSRYTQLAGEKTLIHATLSGRHVTSGKKAPPSLPGGLRVLIFDGHEMWTSCRQCREGALSRQQTKDDEE